MLYPESNSQSDTKKEAILKQADIHSDVKVFLKFFVLFCSFVGISYSCFQYLFFISRSVSLIKLNLSQIKFLEPFFLFYF